MGSIIKNKTGTTRSTTIGSIISYLIKKTKNNITSNHTISFLTRIGLAYIITNEILKLIKLSYDDWIIMNELNEFNNNNLNYEYYEEHDVPFFKQDAIIGLKNITTITSLTTNNNKGNII